MNKFSKVYKAPYKGKFRPSNPRKYKGDPTNIIFRSSWERRFMQYCDTNKEILEWGSEEVWIPYRSYDKKVHRYFPDFYMKVRQPNGTYKKFIVEIKPKYQTVPPKKPQRQSRQYLNSVLTYAKNEAKWKYAKRWCQSRDMNFIILTEDHLKTF